MTDWQVLAAAYVVLALALARVFWRQVRGR